MVTPAEVRAWAKEQGKNVGSRGRLPIELYKEYEACHPDTPADLSAPGIPGPLAEWERSLLEKRWDDTEPTDAELAAIENGDRMLPGVAPCDFCRTGDHHACPVSIPGASTRNENGVWWCPCALRDVSRHPSPR